MLSIVTSLVLIAAQPMPTATEFKQLQALVRSARLVPPKLPLPLQRHANAPPAPLEQAAIDQATREMADAFFIDGTFGEAVTIGGDFFSFPNVDSLKVDVTWTSAIDAAGKNHLRPRTDEEKEEAKNFRRGSIRDGAFSDEVPLDVDADEITQVDGEAKFEFAASYDVAKLSCAAPGVANKVGSWNVTLVECNGSFFRLRYDDNDWQDPLPPDGDVVVSNAEGVRLSVNESHSEVLSQSGKRVAEIDYEEFKRGPSRTRIFEALAQGTVAQVDIYHAKAMRTHSVRVSATTAPRGDEPVDLAKARYVRPEREPAPTAAYDSLDEKRLKAETTIKSGRSAAMFGFNAPRVYVMLPKVANSAFAEVKLDKVKPTLAKKGKWKLEDNGFDAAKQRHAYSLSGEGEAPVAATKIAGVAKLSYPLVARVIELDVATPNREGVEAAFAKNQVLFKFVVDEAAATAAVAAPDYATVRAFDARGRELRRLSYSSSDGETTTLGFWGKPAKVSVVMTGAWTELTLPFALKVPPQLPKSKSGAGGDH